MQVTWLCSLHAPTTGNYGLPNIIIARMGYCIQNQGIFRLLQHHSISWVYCERSFLFFPPEGRCHALPTPLDTDQRRSSLCAFSFRTRRLQRRRAPGPIHSLDRRRRPNRLFPSRGRHPDSRQGRPETPQNISTGPGRSGHEFPNLEPDRQKTDFHHRERPRLAAEPAFASLPAESGRRVISPAQRHLHLLVLGRISRRTRSTSLGIV